MGEFRLIELLTYYAWHFVDIRLHYFHDGKSDFLNIFLYSYGFSRGARAPHL
jgi:hypothetical protein